MSAIVAGVKKKLSCEVLGISTRPIADGNLGYAAWIAQETALNQPTAVRDLR